MRAKLLQDAISVAISSYPPPAFSDEAAVGVWVGKLATGLTAVAYDAIRSDTAAAVACCAAGDYSDDEVEAAFVACYSDRGLCAALPEKIGDGTILNFLKSVNWAQLIQTVITIISVIPKAA